MTRIKQRGVLSWLFLGGLLALCVVLGVLQYRWIGEVSRAERERLRANLQASLERLSEDLNLTIATESRTLLPFEPQSALGLTEAAIADRYAAWKRTGRRSRIFRRIAIAEPRGETVLLRSLDMEEGVFRDTEWPEEWRAMKDRSEPRREMQPWQKRGPPGPPPGQPGLAFALPILGTPRPPGPIPGPFERRALELVIFELDLPYIRDVMLPELLQRHLGDGGSLDYEVAVLTRGGSPAVIYPADPGQALRIAGAADGSVVLFDPQPMLALRPTGPGGPPEGGRGPGRGRASPGGRWQMFVRHRAGSLEAVVSMARRRNLAVTAGVMLLLMASVAALVRFTRHAQRLAELQMEFVAGVSHELRTPLTVIHTAAYNLRGKLANDPAQVEKYGALIQRESGRLAEMVDQVMQFASSEAGRSAQEREHLSIEAVLEEAIESSKAVIEASQCVVEKTIDPELPLILGDPAALRRAFENLLSNAAKHGSERARWIGVSASLIRGKEQDAVEVRVGDRGPGIPTDEQRHIFDPFFRGRRAVRDQIHGSGLGLNLVKRIVEEHGGSIRVKSEPGRLTEFLVRIPALAREQRDEFAHSTGRG